MNNVALVLSPSNEPETDIFAMTVQTKHVGPGSFAQHFEKTWPENTARHFLPIEHKYATHLVLIEGEARPGQSFYFTNENIFAMSVVLYFCERKQLFIPLHCEKCSKLLLDWLLDHQEKWRAECKSVSQGPKTLH